MSVNRAAIQDYRLEDIPKIRALAPELAPLSDSAIEVLWSSFSDDCYAASWLILSGHEYEQEFVEWVKK